MYYNQQPRPEDDRPPGCLDVLVITRAVFAVLMWPALVLVAGVLAVGLIFFAYSVHPALALLPIAAIVAAVFAYARWEQHHYRPPDL